jgi:hypothetical protein
MGVFYMVLTIGAGVFFYWMRCRRPLWYGLCEIAVSIGVIYLTFYPGTTYLVMEEQPPLVGSTLEWIVGVLAGIYILVRGLDNLERGLPRAYQSIWNRVFRSGDRETTTQAHP